MTTTHHRAETENMLRERHLPGPLSRSRQALLGPSFPCTGANRCRPVGKVEHEETAVVRPDGKRRCRCRGKYPRCPLQRSQETERGPQIARPRRTPPVVLTARSLRRSCNAIMQHNFSRKIHEMPSRLSLLFSNTISKTMLSTPFQTKLLKPIRYHDTSSTLWTAGRKRCG